MTDTTLERVLDGLGVEAGTEAQIQAALAEISGRQEEMPALLVGEAGGTVTLPSAASEAKAISASGEAEGLAIEQGELTLPERPGYYDLQLDSSTTRLAVAPARCPALFAGEKCWGVSLQIPSLCGNTSRAFGNAGELAELAESLAGQGADALAISPVHALFPGQGQCFSPYSPSSRLFLNGMAGDPALVGLPDIPDEPVAELIAWETAIPARFAALQTVFDGLGGDQLDRIARDMFALGDDLFRHAIFDALDQHFRPGGAHGWQDWPEEFRQPDSAAVAQFARDNAREVSFHLFLQWLARESMARAQKTAKKAGMAIGLIGDLAVGVDPAGSDCWSLGDAMLRGLTVGAPPDTFSPDGQNWALTTFSPTGLQATGFAPFIAMLRSAMRSCGGLRIDHAFGLSRLWVIPEGCAATEGAYLQFPQEDMLRLVALEAHLAGAIIIAEDLGTAPPGFTQAIENKGMMGMQVLWFQRAEDDGFIGPQDYAPTSVAMTGTHDTATVAGWWKGRDLDWASDLGRLPQGVDRAEAESKREWDRGLLWSTFANGQDRPEPQNPAPVVDAALAHVAATPSPLAIAPIEDVLGLEEQPNLPGTVTEHPNWRRRLPLSVDEIAADPDVQRRLSILSRD